MRYMLLIYTNENAEAQRSPEEVEAVKAGHWAVMSEAANLGILQGAEPLEPTSSATTVRAQNGKVMAIDGPFAETKEQLAGYYILECKDLNEAVAWAAKIPTACGGGSGCVEVRPLREMTHTPESAVEWRKRLLVQQELAIGLQVLAASGPGTKHES